jgi:hypothetical protein
VRVFVFKITQGLLSCLFDPSRFKAKERTRANGSRGVMALALLLMTRPSD